MTRFRSSMILLGVCVIALVVSWLRVAVDTRSLPVGSSFSAQPDGVLALYEWVAATGGSPRRQTSVNVDEGDPPRVLVIVQPESPITESVGDAYASVARQGGTIVLAGNSLPAQLYARTFDVVIEPAQLATSARSEDGLTLSLTARTRVRADGATPVLTSPSGDWLALRKPYLNGEVIVLATPDPLTNDGLRDEATARFVYREVVGMAGSGQLAFDEAHHTFAPVTERPVTANDLLFATAPGQALVYAALLTFVYLLLGGRRLGPPLPMRAPADTRRTMFEHVQMLANLHRRAGHLVSIRSALGRHYVRRLTRGRLATGQAAHLGAAITRIEAASSEPELLSAVADAEDS